MILQVMRPESTENSRAHRIIDYLSVFILVLLIFIIKITAITHERTSAIINVVHTSHIMPLSAAATNENPHATGSTKSVCLHIDITSDCSPESSAWNTPWNATLAPAKTKLIDITRIAAMYIFQ